MSHTVGFLMILFFLTNKGILGESLSDVDLTKTAIIDWMECGLDSSPTNCLEERTVRCLQKLNVDLMRDFSLQLPEIPREGKVFNGTSENTEMLDTVELENQSLIRSIQERRAQSRGIIDEIGDIFTSLTFRLLDPFTSASEEESSENNVEQEDEVTLIEERGHKKKELKKKNKQLKLILLLMLLKNKIKMFVNKLQFLVQLKFLLVATINMLANVIRLWIELKKKHKPNKVVYYENAHHQHHYDHEHIHDHDDGHHHYSHPGSYSHHAHHEEEDYGGGPWPWSRSYAEKQGEITYHRINPYRRHPGGSSIVYLNQRPLR